MRRRAFVALLGGIALAAGPRGARAHCKGMARIVLVSTAGYPTWYTWPKSGA
jgi:hypothetical protein